MFKELFPSSKCTVYKMWWERGKPWEPRNIRHHYCSSEQHICVFLVYDCTTLCNSFSWGSGRKGNSLIQEFSKVGDWQITISSTRNKVRYRKENGYVNMVITIDGEQKEHDSQDKHKEG